VLSGVVVLPPSSEPDDPDEPLPPDVPLPPEEPPSVVVVGVVVTMESSTVAWVVVSSEPELPSCDPEPLDPEPELSEQLDPLDPEPLDPEPEPPES
jgi:hypothetical protein